ncbi:putative membrane protein [Vibrio cholerae]|nr:putative membrane protein [Vibrio cholerae]
MILSALQFLIAILFSIVAAYVAGLSEGDIPIIAFLIPALWLLPKSGFSSVVMLLAMGDLWPYLTTPTGGVVYQSVGAYSAVDGGVFST